MSHALYKTTLSEKLIFSLIIPIVADLLYNRRIVMMSETHDKKNSSPRPSSTTNISLSSLVKKAIAIISVLYTCKLLQDKIHMLATVKQKLNLLSGFEKTQLTKSNFFLSHNEIVNNFHACIRGVGIAYYAKNIYNAFQNQQKEDEQSNKITYEN